MKIVDVIRELNVLPTVAEIRRVANQGGIRIGNTVIKDVFSLFPVGNHVIHIGKSRKYYVEMKDWKISRMYEMRLIEQSEVIAN